MNVAVRSSRNSAAGGRTADADHRRFYRPELDALRFFAFLAVFICHASQNASVSSAVSGHSWLVRAFDQLWGLMGEVGAFGVSMFFLLSGYLITTLMLLEYQRTGGFNVKDFYIRRILRIWPLYFTIIAIFAILSWVDPHNFYISRGRIIAFLALAGNWYMIARGTAPQESSVLWSISVEEQFYLLWPGIFALGRRRGIVLAGIVFPILSVAALCYLGFHGVTRISPWMNSFVQFVFFAIGGIIALRTEKKLPGWTKPQRVLLVGGGLALWFFSEATTHIQRRDLVLHTQSLLLGFAMLAIGSTAIFTGVQGIKAAAVPGWLRYLGKISYGLYVFHPLAETFTVWTMSGFAHRSHMQGVALNLFRLAAPFAALGVTIAVSMLSYQVLEKPFLRLRRGFTIVPSRAA